MTVAEAAGAADRIAREDEVVDFLVAAVQTGLGVHVDVVPGWVFAPGVNGYPVAVATTPWTARIRPLH